MRCIEYDVSNVRYFDFFGTISNTGWFTGMIYVSCGSTFRFVFGFPSSVRGLMFYPFPEDRLLQDRVATDLRAAPAVPPFPASRERRHKSFDGRGEPGGQRRSAPLPVLLLPGASEYHTVTSLVYLVLSLSLFYSYISFSLLIFGFVFVFFFPSVCLSRLLSGFFFR